MSADILAECNEIEEAPFNKNVILESEENRFNDCHWKQL
jgi:hypothetical protein